MAETFKEWADRNGVTIKATHVSNRPDGFMDNDDMVHFNIVLESNVFAKTIYAGFYSVGSGHPLSWARRKESECKAMGIPSAGYLVKRDVQELKGVNLRSLWAESHLQNIRKAFERAAPIPVGDVLCSLHCDISGIDQGFEDWAADLGFDEDSRSAYRIYEHCREMFFSLRKAIPVDEFAKFLECEE